MRILWVKPGKLLPLDTGGKLRSYYILRHLSRISDLAYLSYYGGPRDENYEEEIAKLVPGAFCVSDAFPIAIGIRRGLAYVCSLGSSVPYAVSQFGSPPVRSLITEWMAQRRFDVAICDFLASTQTFPRHLAVPTVLFQHNVESQLWKRREEAGAIGPGRLVAKFEHSRMRRYEARQVRRFHGVFVVSDNDRLAMRKLLESSPISVIPTGVDLSEYSFDPNSQTSESLVVFTGSMDWQPNIDGVEYFCREIWPDVISRVPRARFRIVGRTPGMRVRKLASTSIEVTGSVPSVLPHLRAAAVVVVPLRMGGGTRIKIYEGMAMGKATVSTHIGAEGLEVHDQRDILLTDNPKQFAAHIVTLLTDRVIRRQYETAAAAAVENLDWSIIAQRFLKEAEKIAFAKCTKSAVSEQTGVSGLIGSAVGRNQNSYATSLTRHVDYETR